MSIFSTIQELRLASIQRKVPNVSEENGKFLYMMTRSLKPKRILEIGTANGISTLYFAAALAANGEGKIYSIEPQEKDHLEAKKHLEICTLEQYAQLYLGRVQDVLPTLDETFDLVFIDGMKREYAEYFLLSLWKTHENTVFLFDDVIKFRHKMEGLFTLLEERHEDFEWTTIPTDADDGVLFLHKK